MSGPRLVTVTVYVTGSPGRAVDGTTRLVMTRSASGPEAASTAAAGGSVPGGLGAGAGVGSSGSGFGGLGFGGSGLLTNWSMNVQLLRGSRAVSLTWMRPCDAPTGRPSQIAATRFQWPPGFGRRVGLGDVVGAEREVVGGVAGRGERHALARDPRPLDVLERRPHARADPGSSRCRSLPIAALRTVRRPDGMKVLVNTQPAPWPAASVTRTGVAGPKTLLPQAAPTRVQRPAAVVGGQRLGDRVGAGRAGQLRAGRDDAGRPGRDALARDPAGAGDP